MSDRNHRITDPHAAPGLPERENERFRAMEPDPDAPRCAVCDLMAGAGPARLTITRSGSTLAEAPCPMPQTARIGNLHTMIVGGAVAPTEMIFMRPA
ncbi:hypothetical protein [Ponticoccus alexandrii]|uniref:Uncharacterized protein n=1 Tax=Ponticoccus alexandrii TaxID=1943633 RepID=A0ABX7FAB1_9RHOB|nr:hypothetical protein [Ponticoccus alexandrii]ETA49731.1 hypothetical protein P279_23175 [Rhodobacteraceae bacterium PD-2]QRF67490.1 hypothetical protein GQA70_14920 [Ponticoccus alexandrii]